MFWLDKPTTEIIENLLSESYQYRKGERTVLEYRIWNDGDSFTRIRGEWLIDGMDKETKLFLCHSMQLDVEGSND